MSKFGKQILKRLHPFSPLQNPNNDGHIVIDNTIGEWLDDWESQDRVKQFFILHATGKYLDLHGNAKSVPRKEGEDDESYRQRILRERGMLNSIHDWKEAGVTFWDSVNSITGVGAELYFQVLNGSGDYEVNVPISVSIENFSTGDTWEDDGVSNSQGIVKFTLPPIEGLATLSYNVNGVGGFSNLEGSLSANDNVFVKTNTLLFCDNSRNNQLRLRLSTSTGTNLAEQNITVKINEETFNLITNKDGIFFGASFNPGMEISLNLFANKTALLPDVEKAEKISEVTGLSTVESMRHGIYWSTVAYVNHEHEAQEKLMGEPLKLILTGGNSNIVKDDIKDKIFDPLLTLKGMNFLFLEEK